MDIKNVVRNDVDINRLKRQKRKCLIIFKRRIITNVLV
jgi:hypothetical protein